MHGWMLQPVRVTKWQKQKLLTEELRERPEDVASPRCGRSGCTPARARHVPPACPPRAPRVPETTGRQILLCRQKATLGGTVRDAEEATACRLPVRATIPLHRHRSAIVPGDQEYLR